MLGAVIIKDMQENSIYSGNPAVDVTPKLGAPWADRTNQQKMTALQERIDQYLFIYPERESEFRDLVTPCIGLPEDVRSDITYIDVSTRKYTKRKTSAEMKFLAWLTSYKGRFTPLV